MNDWENSGARLVYIITIKRLRKCVQEKRHTIGYCKACGVHR